MSDSAGQATPAVSDDLDDSADVGPRSRRGRWIAAAAISAVVIVGVAVAIVVTRPEPTYDDASQQRFVTACVADGGEQVRAACTCLYTAISEQIPYDRFVEVDEELSAAREAGEEIVLPDDIAALVPACQVPA
jgi:hypothetical protein